MQLGQVLKIMRTEAFLKKEFQLTLENLKTIKTEVLCLNH